MTAPLPDVAEVGADNAAHMAEQALLGAACAQMSLLWCEHQPRAP